MHHANTHTIRKPDTTHVGFQQKHMYGKISEGDLSPPAPANFWVRATICQTSFTEAQKAVLNSDDCWARE
jgi:hypothetical protein